MISSVTLKNVCNKQWPWRTLIILVHYVNPQHHAYLYMYIYLHVCNINIWNVNYAQTTAFIFDSGIGVLEKVSKFFRQNLRIHAEYFAIWVGEARHLFLLFSNTAHSDGVDVFACKVNISNVDCVEATELIFDSQKDVLESLGVCMYIWGHMCVYVWIYIHSLWIIAILAQVHHLYRCWLLTDCTLPTNLKIIDSEFKMF